jgi:cytochrome P450
MTTQPHPDPPRAPHFDSVSGAWILSRYADVLAALQHPHLWPVGGNREIQPESRDEAGRLKLRADVLARFSQAHLTEWRPRIAAEACRILEGLPTGRPVDLFAEFALPWGLTLAILATGADPADRRRLGALSTRVFAATGADDDSPQRADAAAATAELERIFENGRVPMGEPTFVALSQTMPRLLANAWLALVLHPGEFARLRASPDLMPGAVEELLRYSGIVRRVFRRSTAVVELGGVTIGEGDLVTLMLASAGRDPAQFPDPDRLDLGRPIAGHVSLGSGRNSCVGAGPIRMAMAVATGGLAATFPAVELASVGEWRMGSGFWFPASVHVNLRRGNCTSKHL